MKFELRSIDNKSDNVTEMKFVDASNATFTISVLFVDNDLFKVQFLTHERVPSRLDTFTISYWWHASTRQWSYWEEFQRKSVAHPPKKWKEEYWKVIDKAIELNQNKILIHV